MTKAAAVWPYLFSCL